jgi:hypothetical protein
MEHSDDEELGISYRRRRVLDLEGEVQSRDGLAVAQVAFICNFAPLGASTCWKTLNAKDPVRKKVR